MTKRSNVHVQCRDLRRRARAGRVSLFLSAETLKRLPFSAAHRPCQAAQKRRPTATAWPRVTSPVALSCSLTVHRLPPRSPVIIPTPLSVPPGSPRCRSAAVLDGWVFLTRARKEDDRLPVRTGGLASGPAPQRGALFFQGKIGRY